MKKARMYIIVKISLKWQSPKFKIFAISWEANQLTGFYMSTTLAFNGFKREWLNLFYTFLISPTKVSRDTARKIKCLWYLILNYFKELQLSWSRNISMVRLLLRKPFFLAWNNLNILSFLLLFLWISFIVC